MGKATEGVLDVKFAQLEDVLRAVPVVIVHVSDLADKSVPAKVVEAFRIRYRDDFRCVRIVASKVPYRPWLTDLLRPACPTVNGFADGGLYLFLGGRGAAFHPGINVTAAVIELLAFAATSGRVQHESDIHAQEILDLFVPLVGEFMARRRPAIPAPDASQVAEEEACALLGVRPDATDKDIDKAWRRLRGEYAPDKVQHVNAAFVRLASKTVLQIDNARDVLRRRRRSA